MWCHESALSASATVLNRFIPSPLELQGRRSSHERGESAMRANNSPNKHNMATSAISRRSPRARTNFRSQRERESAERSTEKFHLSTFFERSLRALANFRSQRDHGESAVKGHGGLSPNNTLLHSPPLTSRSSPNEKMLYKASSIENAQECRPAGIDQFLG
ncbi:hypothetical protein Bbelb_242780 [Branchiostoma belcheri]|nr:hypothetical protein Bbelb_242780 [Branchiostoma belcheri]